MFLPRLYIDWLDALAVLGSIAVCAAMLMPSFRRDGEFTDSEGVRLRLAAVVPLFFATVMTMLGGGLFTVARLVFHVGAVVYPLLGFAYLALLWRRDTRSAWSFWAARGFAIVCVLLAPLAAWMTFVEPFRLDVHELDIATDAGGEPVRIAVLADIQTDHFGEWEEYVLAETNRLKPDIIVLPGDVLQTFEDELQRELPGALHFLRRLEAPHGVYLVDGDIDRDPTLYTRAQNVTFLPNEIAHIDVRGRTIALAGTELSYNSPGAAETVRRLEGDDAELKILLGHRPMLAATEARPNSTVDLVIAGHTHGGQIALPVIGPLLTMSAAPRSVGAGGLHQFSGRQIYVSRGIGMERHHAPRVRLLATPELPVLVVR